MMSNPRAQVTIDHEPSLATSIARLAHEFEGTFGLETIERFVHSSYGELAAGKRYEEWAPPDPAG